ncbi:hypothetical protein VTK73DRAFT_1371 [Phialemonium thermophilum]|uniref:Uncharacterized protein n=1 Tax=Phialemonium thermophilum TaxID=223376 RepID=A0ABR3XA97_9PEZI
MKFTTSAYPPLYDPALTLNSRRFFTVSSQLSPPTTPVTRPLQTSHGLLPTHHPLQQGVLEAATSDTEPRPRSAASSTVSNPASQPRSQDGPQNPKEKAGLPAQPFRETQQSQNGQETRRVEAIEVDAPPASRLCDDCVREANTYLVELTNYPALHQHKVREQVLNKGDYDAVLLVYDVGDRSTFEAIPGLAAEVPVSRERKHRGYRRHHQYATTEPKNSGTEARMKRYRSSMWRGSARHSPTTARIETENGGFEMENSGNFAKDPTKQNIRERKGFRDRFGVGEIVVALVGNKSDIDIDCDACGTHGDIIDEDMLLLEEKRGVLQEVDVEERSLLHPLYRESRLFGPKTDILNGDDSEDILFSPPLSPLSLATQRRGLRDVLDGDAMARARARTAKPWETRSGAAAEDGEGLDAARHSVLSADHGLTGQRTSVLSRRSVRSMQEGREKHMPRMPITLRNNSNATTTTKTDAIESWLRTGSPTTATGNKERAQKDRTNESATNRRGEKEHEEGSEVTTAAACGRQVAPAEGEALARSLLLNVPFLETSAKTGENVEEAFGALVCAVLRETGRAVVTRGTLDEVEIKKCRKKHGQGKQEPATPLLTKTRHATVNRGHERKSVAAATVLMDDGADGVGEAVFEDVPLGGPDGPNPSSTSSQKRLGETMLERFTKLFTRKSAVMVADVAG